MPLHTPCFHHISEFNVAFDPLHFVLMFPRGEAGWGLGIPKGLLRSVPNAMAVIEQAVSFLGICFGLPFATGVHLKGFFKWIETVNDDIGAVDEPGGGGGVVTNVWGEATSADVDLEDRALADVAMEEDTGVSSRGRTVTLRDFMAFYLFTRGDGSTSISF